MSTSIAEPPTVPEATELRAASVDPSADRPEMIVVRNLFHTYTDGGKENPVLRDINLTIREGELVIVKGPSGSGKSSLLVLAGTLRKVQRGSLLLDGDELLGASDRQILKLRRKIGFIFQAHNLFASLTAYQNVKMALELFPKQKDDRERIVSMLKRLELEDKHIGFRPGQLSGGQKQRVAVARGLIHRPRLLLADEPTAALDVNTSRTVVTMLQEATRGEGDYAGRPPATVMMVTHDSRIMDVADRIVTIEDGRVKSNHHVQETKRICEFLDATNLFRRESNPNWLTDIATKMTRREYKAGETVVTKGEIGDAFYLIRSGEADVYRDSPESSAPVATLTPHGVQQRTPGADEPDVGFFGELSLLDEEPKARNATVVAKTDLLCYTLSRDEFRKLLDESPSFEDQIRRALSTRG